MTKVKIVICVITLIVLVGGVFLITSSKDERPIIIQTAINDVLSNGMDFQYAESDNSEIIVLNNKIVNKSDFEGIKDKKITLLIKEEIDKRVRINGNFVYIEFNEYSYSSGTAKVKISCLPTKTELLFGGELDIKYTKVDNKWIGTIENSEIS